MRHSIRNFLVAGAILTTTFSVSAHPTFTKITEGAVVTNRLASWGCGWADFDNDGLLDLVVALSNGVLIHRNLGDGTFTNTQERLGLGTTSLSWGDFDNDGHLDFLTSGMGAAPGITNTLFRNNGDGTFGRVLAGQLVTERNGMYASSWADFDNDGYLDAFLAGVVAGRRLHHNNGDGTFTRITNSALVEPPNGTWQGIAWGDYNNDGRMDVFVSCGYSSGKNLLCRNDGAGRFTSITNAAPVKAGTAYWDTASWIDYDNDGNLDLFVNKWGPGEMYQNNGDGTFARVTGGMPRENACATAWGDYDNDGYLDVFFAKQGGGGGGLNALYRNNGDGTFTQILGVSPVEDAGISVTPGWGDYDNDGFLDLFVANDGGGNNFLYHNDGNGNHWLKLKLVGLASNRAAIGAKVRVRATIGGQPMWQMREVNTGSGFGGNDLNPHFGLGDATNVDVVRIEWPSGNVQELADVAPNQTVTVKEAVDITPTNPSSSLNGSVTLSRAVVPEGNYQWRFAGGDLVGETNRTLKLTNIQAGQAGPYSIVVTTAEQRVTNHVYLMVDEAFTEITAGAPATDLGSTSYGSWGDYDGDAYPDLFVARLNNGRSALYHNNRDGTFAAVTDAPFAQRADAWMTGAWADLDNDGHPDLVTTRWNRSAILYFNDGNGTFTSRELNEACPGDVVVFDYDRDGLLDLLLYGSMNWSEPAPSWLYRNQGDRTFTRMSSKDVGPIVDFRAGGVATSADYDDDGWADVFCPNNAGGSRLFRGDSTGRLELATNVVLQIHVCAGAWSDYDNDGQVDLCAVSGPFNPTIVYRNLGDGNLERATIGQTIQGDYYSAGWADYDNDGFLDLLVTSIQGGKNAFYHNNGDGTFARVTTGSIVTKVPTGGAGTWAGLWFDYDNDGFLDLYLFNNNDPGSAISANFLYHNNGNSNAWLVVKPIGTASNRDGVGAKVRVQAKYAGQLRWQRRDISGGDVVAGNQLLAHFGLGSATNVTTLRIEWPSGAVQEFTDVAPKQLLTIWEPPIVRGAVLEDDSCQLTITAEPNKAWRIEASADLATWQTLETVTSAQATFQFKDSAANGVDCRFYRVVSN
ncbi:MAG: FG-GAP-like repeat-containing protein [Verrucomicrobiia bacterium]